MEPAIMIAVALALVGYTAGSVKIINQGEEALVQRLGRYHRTLKPGLNFVIPVLDTVLVESTREQILDIDPQTAITRDNATVTVDAIVYWRILELFRAYYEVENLEEALKNLVITTLRSEVGLMNLKELVSSRNRINQELLRSLDEATESWGVKILRIEVQEIKLSAALTEARNAELAAESRRKAALSESQAAVESIRIISDALREAPNAKAMLQYLVAKSYIDASQKLGESNNSKIIFMDPKALSDTVSELIAADENEGLGGTSSSDNTPPTD